MLIARMGGLIFPIMNQWDAIVIGGGPAGSTAAHILAKAGKSVLLIEGETFPRFHIGESLLPASTPIFKRLGLLERMQENFILKPGGKWFVGPGRWRGQFAECDPSACFAEEPYAFMVERSLFDKILLERAREVGVRILSPARVLQPLMDGERVTGLRVRHPDGQTVDYRCPIVFDCSGRATFLARKFGLLSPTTLNRMALYSYYRATPQDPDLQDGWFVGQMIADGWTWAIPLKDGRISVGVVFNQDQLAADRDPDDFYEASLRASGFLERVFKAGFRRVDEIKR
ncbi:MAG TPA: NAD(P)/FAD-dependent oxidoreductase, partial [Bdellovibrionales bacterium]|nr:NAD(P)/FAD-dependent oxidoreductase [Bdellovibrionales bacterium]